MNSASRTSSLLLPLAASSLMAWLLLCPASLSAQESVASQHSATPCPVFGEGLAMGLIANPALNETSGLAASQSQPDVVWSHNDSGDLARLYALTLDGATLGTWTLPVGIPYDCEALAIGPAPDADGDHLFLADVGNNALSREQLLVYRIREPSVNDSDANALLQEVVTFKVLFPPGVAEDLEAFAVDPISGDFLFFGKRYDQRSRFLTAPAPQPGETVHLKDAGTLPVTLATGADISRDGEMLLLRTYEEVFLFVRQNDESWPTALQRPACPLPLAWENQGEAITFLADGSGYVTVSEGAGQPLIFYPRIERPTGRGD